MLSALVPEVANLRPLFTEHFSLLAATPAIQPLRRA
jgi:hypothetical protein